MADELIDRGLPAKSAGMRQAALARDVERRAGRPPQILVDDPGAAVTDHIIGPSRWKCRDRYAAGERLEQHETKGFGTARHHHDIGGGVMAHQRLARLRAGEMYMRVAPL